MYVHTHTHTHTRHVQEVANHYDVCASLSPSLPPSYTHTQAHTNSHKHTHTHTHTNAHTHTRVRQLQWRGAACVLELCGNKDGRARVKQAGGVEALAGRRRVYEGLKLLVYAALSYYCIRP